MTTEALDPLYLDAPHSGEVVRRMSSYWPPRGGGYLWRKAQGSTCVICRETIDGRRYEVTSRLAPEAWRHVACVAPETWDRWMSAPAPGPKTRKPAQPGTKTWLKNVAKAANTGTQVELDPAMVALYIDAGIEIPENLKKAS